MSIWKTLPRPFSVLAPMEEVTDTVFRRLIGELAAPDLYYTEFTSTDGICSPGREKVSKRLKFSETERPLIAQIWGNSPENYKESAAYVASLGFDGIDINIGCPAKKIAGKGACSALIDRPELVRDLYFAAQEGAPHLPISIKTRIGTRKTVTESWCGFILRELKPAALIVHARTAKEMSKVPARWEEIAKVVKLRDELSQDTVIVGNGDVFTWQQKVDFPAKYGVDGVMIGRGIFHDPLIFRRTGPGFESMNIEQRFNTLIRHMDLFQETWGDNKDFNVLKRFFKIYINSFEGAVSLRTQLMETKSFSQARDLLGNWSPPPAATLKGDLTADLPQ